MITGDYASFVALIFITLSLRVTLYRRENMIRLGGTTTKA